MAFPDFPSNPTSGQVHLSSNGSTYEYNGTKWVVSTGVSSGTLPDNSVTSAKIADGAVAAADLAATGVVAATYGDASNVPQITVNAKGQVTAAVAVPISAGISSDADNILTLGLDGKPKLDRNVDGGGAVFV